MSINTLANSSDKTLYLKSKFFIYRALGYATFLLVPVWAQKILDLSHLWHVLFMAAFILFLCGQWFLLGKEIDHRFKIYYQTRSSLDRILYRILIGKVVFIAYFNLIAYLPSHVIKHFYWGTFVILGLFYSWPTRGKIIRESVSSGIKEFQFLDSFEKIVGVLIVIFLLFSLPRIPDINNIEALKFFFDPMEVFSPVFWNFLKINYFPFLKIPELFKYAWCIHFYFLGVGILLIASLAFFRYFVGRRVALLGVFSIISSWSFVKILAEGQGHAISTSLIPLWIWAIFWVGKSGSYRTSILLGALWFYSTLFNDFNFIFSLLVFVYFFLFYIPEKNSWYKLQCLKYTLAGFFISLTIFFEKTFSDNEYNPVNLKFFVDQMIDIFSQKSFNILAIFGLLIILIHAKSRNFFRQSSINLSFGDLRKVLYFILGSIIFAFIFNSTLVERFTILHFTVLIALLPVECLLQSTGAVRSSRNIIFAAYILFAILDSHLEGRVKMFLHLFE